MMMKNYFRSGGVLFPPSRYVFMFLAFAVLEIAPILATSRDPVCPIAFFNFGDSFTATGSSLNAFPFTTPFENPPYGDTFFRRPAKRVTDGRVVPDFFSQAFQKPLLQPYIQAGDFDYRYGINFAYAEATASNDSSRTPFFLPIQVAQFVRFKRSSDSEKRQSECNEKFLPVDGAFENGLYTIFIGGNDINYAVLRNNTAAQIRAVTIPAAINNTERAIRTLYANGARKFLIFNINPAGCSTIVLTLIGGPLDRDGCNALINGLDRDYNTALLALITRLRTQLAGSTISLFNYYEANLEILRNPQRYGLDPALTKTACCGAPGVGTLNYNPAVVCGAGTGATKCADPNVYVNWDGIRQTEAFYRIIATFALNGQFTDVSIDYASRCDLDLSDFGPNATFEKVYDDDTCEVTFT